MPMLQHSMTARGSSNMNELLLGASRGRQMTELSAVTARHEKKRFPDSLKRLSIWSSPFVGHIPDGARSGIPSFATSC